MLYKSNGGGTLAMSTVLIVTIAIVAIPLIYLATLEGRYSVRRSLEIGAGQQVVFDKLRDFRSWHDWSPWLMHEPDTTMDYSDTPDQEGGWYSWDGKSVGAGRLTHEKFTGTEKIEQRIVFQRPFKSVSRVFWELEKRDDNRTLVHWNMAGRMPFLLRFMTKKMQDFISKDYDTGLYMLRAELEPGAEVPRITFGGPTEVPTLTALTIPFDGHLDAMKQAMSEGFPKLIHFIDAHHISATGYPFAIYHKVNLRKMHFTCDMAVPVSEETRSTEFTLKTFPGRRYYKTIMKGSYEFMELAWYQAYSHLQMQKIKPLYNLPSLEVYETDPDAVSHTNEIITSIYIPIK
jgi:DNA gyrase inhibitor GyrI